MGNQNQQGFTLIEVLVAFAILALSLSAIFQVYMTSFANTRVADEYAIATALAESKIAETSEATPLSLGLRTGQYQNRFNWSIRVEDEPEFTSQTSLIQVYRIVAKVEWGGSGDPRSVDLVTYRAVQNE